MQLLWDYCFVPDLVYTAVDFVITISYLLCGDDIDFLLLIFTVIEVCVVVDAQPKI